jgi:hypothetical protein
VIGPRKRVIACWRHTSDGSLLSGSLLCRCARLGAILDGMVYKLRLSPQPMTNTSDTRLSACRNCGSPLPAGPRAAYCPACGQETTLHAPTFGEFAHEFIGHYVAVEGRLWRTLAALLLRPGRLTREYLAGRRRRYVLPMRLYLTASFLFFVLVKVVGLGTGLQVQVAFGVDDQGRPLEAPPKAVVEQVSRALADCEKAAACSWIERRAWQAADTAIQRGAIETQRRLAAMMPYAVFALLPYFAALLALAYRRRGITYGEHFVFGLHMHSFWFVAMLIGALVANALAQVVLAALAMAYGLWALRHVYGGRWLPTCLRGAFISVLYLAGLTLLVILATVLAAAG